MKRRAENPDSLEMLLDTMCNTFGGIIMIALLISLLARESAEVSEETENTKVSREIDGARADKAETELKAATDLNRTLQAQANSPDHSNVVANLMARENLRSETERLESEIVTTSSNIVELQKSAAMSREQRLASISGQLEKTSKLLREETQKNKDIRRQEVEIRLQDREAIQAMAEQLGDKVSRLPQERTLQTTPLEIIIKHNRLFPINLVAQEQLQPNQDSIRSETTSDGSRIITVLPERGMTVDSADLGRFLASIPKSRYYLSLRVYEDSFKTFSELKKRALRAGLDYGWEPLPMETVVITRPGAGGLPGQ